MKLKVSSTTKRHVLQGGIMENQRLFRLSNGSIFVISMNSYLNQKDVLQTKTKILEVEPMRLMLLRCLKRVFKDIRSKKVRSLKQELSMFSRQIKLIYL